MYGATNESFAITRHHDKPPYTISPYQQTFFFFATWTHIITLERLRFVDIFFLQIIPVDLLMCCWSRYFIVPKFLLSNRINEKKCGQKIDGDKKKDESAQKPRSLANDWKISATHLKFITKIKRAQSMTMIMKQRLSENFGSRIACEASCLRFFCLHYDSHFFSFETISKR